MAVEAYRSRPSHVESVLDAYDLSQRRTSIAYMLWSVECEQNKLVHLRCNLSRFVLYFLSIIMPRCLRALVHLKVGLANLQATKSGYTLHTNSQLNSCFFRRALSGKVRTDTHGYRSSPEQPTPCTASKERRRPTATTPKHPSYMMLQPAYSHNWELHASKSTECRELVSGSKTTGKYLYLLHSIPRARSAKYILD